MSDRVLVSIVVNNYNYAQFLHLAIDSALHQTYSQIEVIVVDDGSTDQSRRIIKTYGNKIKPVLKENGGQASALNAGFAISRGQILIFLDADDYLLPPAVEQVVQIWQPALAKVQYRLKVVDACGNRQGVHPPQERPMNSGDVWPLLLKQGRYSTPVTSGNAFNRSVLDKIFPIPESEFRIAADGYLVNLVPFYGAIASIEQPLGVYRIHGKNLWALAGKVEATRLHNYIQHDLQKYQIIKAKATELGYPISPSLFAADYLHLQMRMSSLRLDPHHHPISTDSPIDLICKGLWASWLHPELTLKKRILLSGWFMGVGFMSRSLAALAITWLLMPRSRSRLSKIAFQWPRKVWRKFIFSV
jgi:glycosyltransferase involved in cell wall biosynthesis